MGRKTIELSEEAYGKLAALKREGESFSDVVIRLAGGDVLAESHGVLDDDTADELEGFVDERRVDRSDTHRERVGEFADELDG